MWMELQGQKATHDFLSLYTKDSSFPLEDSRPPSQGYFLKTHDFLKPLEMAEEPEAARRGGPTAERADAATVVHVLPGGIGTYSIDHVFDNGSAAAVKAEVVTCARGPGLACKPEPDRGNVRYGYGYGPGPYAGAAFTLWDASSAAVEDSAARGRITGR